MKIYFWLPSFIWMSLIFYLSSRTGNQLGSMFPFLDSFDWGHFVAYFILALSFYFALVKTVKPKNIYLLSIALSVLYGLTDEFHQAFVPSRQPDIYDLINDTIGATLAMVLIYYRRKKRV